MDTSTAPVSQRQSAGQKADKGGVEQQIILSALHRRDVNPRKRASYHQTWPSSVPDYLQFVLLKENCDTMSVTANMSKLLRLKAGSSAFGYAGTMLIALIALIALIDFLSRIL